ncbi:hypothetical protein BW716_30005 [[Flexibacter] sp. ATCC 35208]|nr:hypothetical protein BW716_30005 [[Flexibacter] sp. ATCC 35208]
MIRKVCFDKDSFANVVWAKKYKANGNEYFNRMKPTFDGGYIAVGTVTNTGTAERDLWLVKTNDTGKVVWSKRLGFNTANGEIGQDVIQQTDSSYAFIGKTNFYGSLTDGMIGVVSADGTAQWIRQFGYNSGDEGYSHVQNGDTLVAFGCAIYSSYYRPILAMFNRYNGTVKKLNRCYHTLDGYTPIGNYSDYINKTSDGYALNIANTTSAGKTNNSFLGISNSGGVLYNKCMSVPLDSVSTQIMPTFVTLDGGLIAAENFTYGGKTQVVFRKFNADKTIGLSNWTRMGSSMIMYCVLQQGDSSYVGSGGYNNGAFLMFTQPSGLRGCSDSTVKVTLNTLSTDYSTTDKFAINYKWESSYMVDYSVTAIVVHPIHKKTGCNGRLQGCYTLHKGLLLCGNSTPVFGTVAVNSVTNCTDNEFFAVSKGTEIYNSYKDSLNGSFDVDYLAMAIAGGQQEVFTVTYSTSEYHYTLSYYDQAGNLVKIIPPAGVVIDRSTDWVNRVRAARAAGTTLVPPHTMATQFRYNTLNIKVAQISPDGGITHFWYDRLGRIILSQDGNQLKENRYRYINYDEIGRINEVGELTSAAVMNDFISRDTTLLSNWLAAASTSRKEIARTNYDNAYSSLSQLQLTPRNLRNRISWTALFNDVVALDTMGFASASFYSYDIGGSVDTVLHDYKQGILQQQNNRFKKLVYHYDLISGKTNQLDYQPGQKDAFYHRYTYDAINRVTNVETSHDGIQIRNIIINMKNLLLHRVKRLPCLLLLTYSVLVIAFYVLSIIQSNDPHTYRIYVHTFQTSLLQLCLHILYAVGAVYILLGFKVRGGYIILTGGIGFLVAIIFDLILLQSFPNWFYLLYGSFHLIILMIFSRNCFRRIVFITILVGGWIALVYLAYSIGKCDLILY